MQKNGMRKQGILFDENHFPERYMRQSIPYPEPGVFVPWIGMVNIILSTFFGLVIVTRYRSVCQKQDFNNLLLRFPELKEEMEKDGAEQSMSLSLEQAEYLIRNAKQKKTRMIMREKKYIEEWLVPK